MEILRQFESKFKTTVAHEQGAQEYHITKKTKGRKSRDTVPVSVR
jgi:hypothetical protein